MNNHHLAKAGDFWKSKIFLAYHAKFTGKKAKGGAKSSDTEELKKLPHAKLQFLGWEKPKNPLLQKSLAGMVAAIKQKDFREAKKQHETAMRLQSKKSMVRGQKLADTAAVFQKHGLL